MKLTESEWIVMNAVWERSPASARDVLERIEAETGWAYTTLKTVLTRLVDKGALSVRKRANTSFYEPLVTRDTARRSAVRLLLDRAFDGTFGSFIHHLVAEAKLAAKDKQKLAAMLDDADRKPRR
jgi:BlaI family transcriptional regulator, penicillinase repressor